MNKFIFITIISIFLCISAFSQNKTDLELSKLSGLVEKIEEFKTLYVTEKGKTRKLNRNFFKIIKFNLQGNVLEQTTFTNLPNSKDGSRFVKYLHKYNKDGKKETMEFYESNLTKPNTTFIYEKESAEKYSLINGLGENLYARWNYEYDNQNNLIKTIKVTFDREGNTKSKTINFFYENKLIAYETTIDSRIEIKGRYVRKAGLGKSEILISYKDGTPYQKTIYKYDEEKRIISLESYKLKVNNKKEIKSEILFSKIILEYRDDKIFQEIRSFQKNGQLLSKTILITKNGRVLLQELYRHSSATEFRGHSGLVVGWQFVQRIVSKCDFDKNDNWIKCVQYKQKKKDSKPIILSIDERKINYY